jgi:hypothetical protein
MYTCVNLWCIASIIELQYNSPRKVLRSFRSSTNHVIAISTSLETFEILNLMFISLMSVDFKFSIFKSSKPQYKKNSWQMDNFKSSKPQYKKNSRQMDNFKSSKPQYKKNSWQMNKLTSVHQNMKTTFWMLSCVPSTSSSQKNTMHIEN